MIQRKFRVYGKVQGVRFRESTRRLAVQLGLSGHAINLSDGSVEVLATGAKAALEQLAAWLQSGPPGARVDRLVQLESRDSSTGELATGEFTTR